MSSRMFSFDSAEIGKAEITPEGYLKAPVTISRTGIANYGYANKVKLPEELFRAETLSSIKGLPITDEHPIENDNYVFVTPENVGSFAKGNISEPRIEGNTIKALATIWDKGLIKKIQSGTHDVSFGYSREDDATPGDFDGSPFDIIQRDIVGNHLAITEKGRMGEMIKLELDSDGHILKKGIQMSIKYLKVENGKIIDGETKTFRNSEGKDIQVDSNLMVDLIGNRDSKKDLEKENKDLKVEVDTLKKTKVEIDSDSVEKIKAMEIDTKVKKDLIKTLNKKIEDSEKDFDSKIDSHVAEKIELTNNAKTLEIDSKDMTSSDIKKAVISKSMDVDTSILSDVEVDAYYKASISMIKKTEIEGDPKENKKIENDSNDIQKTRQDALNKLYAGE